MLGPFVREAVHVQAHFLARLNFGIEDAFTDWDGCLNVKFEDTLVVQNIERLFVYCGRYLQNVQAFGMPCNVLVPHYHVDRTEGMAVDHPIDFKGERQSLVQLLAHCLSCGKYDRVDVVNG